MIRIERWGKRRMAYAVKKAQEAYYVFFHYEGGAEIPAELGRRFRQMDTILRFLTVVKETQQNVRKKKKTADRRRAKEAAAGETTDAAGPAESGAPEPRKREEA
jgi:small subunit ribosomal protein S6